MRADTFRPARVIATIQARAFCLGLVAASFLSAPAMAQDVSPTPVHAADYLGHTVPGGVQDMADWIVDSKDNYGLPFVILHKPEAKVFVFDKDGHLSGWASVLVGLAPGDDTVPGIGTMPLEAIHPDMRTTPAGRFVSRLGNDLGKLDVLWVDYADGIALHRVINTEPAEKRLQRIVSPKASEHRISYGCINVPAKFFDTVIDPAFKDTAGIVYILPEVKPVQAVFPGYYNVGDKAAVLTASTPAPEAGAVSTTQALVSDH